MLRLRPHVVAAGVFFLAAHCSDVAGGENTPAAPADGGSAQVVNGVLTPMYPAVGALLVGSDPNSASAWCTGTLIACQTFLTAAHCVCSTNGVACQGAAAPDPSGYLVFLQDAGFFRVASIATHPDYDFPTSDVAVLTLATAVTGISPLPINTVGPPDEGTRAIIVGFGRSGGDTSDYGLKRLGSVTIARPDGGANGLLWWFFNSPFGEPGSNSNTCNGDSGGPLLLPAATGMGVGGITSGGQKGDCLAGDRSFDTDVSNYADWIASQSVGPLDGSACGDLPAVDSSAAVTFTADGELGANHTSDRSQIDVPAGTMLLRVGFNAVGDGQSDFNFSVRPVSAGGSASATCQQDGPGQYGFCEFAAPTAGPWQIEVERATGAGPYQVTGATYAVDCGDPAHDGWACNDGDPCTLGDTCIDGACHGTVAGNDACVYQQPSSCPMQPHPGCIGPGGPSQTSFTWHPGNARRGFTWRWNGRMPADGGSFGDPTTEREYLLCVYSEPSDGPRLVIEDSIPAGSDWRRSPHGFRLTASSASVTRARLSGGRHGRIGVRINGSDANMLPGLTPAEQAAPVTVQFFQRNGCWESRRTRSGR